MCKDGSRWMFIAKKKVMCQFVRNFKQVRKQKAKLISWIPLLFIVISTDGSSNWAFFPKVNFSFNIFSRIKKNQFSLTMAFTVLKLNGSDMAGMPLALHWTIGAWPLDLTPGPPPFLYSTGRNCPSLLRMGHQLSKLHGIPVRGQFINHWTALSESSSAAQTIILCNHLFE